MVNGRFARVRDFFLSGLWQDEGPHPGFWRQALRLPILAGLGLLRNRSYVQAASLAYVTILAMIPLLALLFAILKSLGIQRLLAAYLTDRLAPGSHEFAVQILEYVEGTQVTSLGVFGVIWLLAALIFLMTDVEVSFNLTWQVPRTRTWSRRLSDYLSIFLLLPILMAVAISLSSGLLSQPDLRRFLSNFMPEAFFWATSSLISLGLLWVAFTFIYLVMPNTRVQFIAALLGGVIGGTLWQAAHYLFAWFQGMATYYNAIYGALYHLLFLVMWIFWSWLVVLFGNEMAFAYQNLPRLTLGWRQARETREPVDEYLALTALLAICGRYIRREPLVTREELAEALASPDSLAQRVLTALVDCRLVLETGEADPRRPTALVPAQPPDQMRVGEVLACLRSDRTALLTQALAKSPRRAAALKVILGDSRSPEWENLTLKDLTEQVDRAS